jgi:hypothetical protein
MSTTRYCVTWWEWNDGVKPLAIADREDSEIDPVIDAHECEQFFDYPHEARLFAQAKANELERRNAGPWYKARFVEQVRGEGTYDDLICGRIRGWHDVDQGEKWFHSRSRVRAKRGVV